MDDRLKARRVEIVFSKEDDDFFWVNDGVQSSFIF